LESNYSDGDTSHDKWIPFTYRGFDYDFDTDADLYPLWDAPQIACPSYR